MQGPCAAKRNWVCWTSSYSIFCFLFIVQCVASSQALLWIENWCFPYRLTESSGWAFHKHIYCHASSLSKLKAKKQKSELHLHAPLSTSRKTPKDLVFWDTLHVLSTSPADGPLWLCTTSTSTVQTPGLYLGKNSVRNRQFGVSHNKLAWKGQLTAAKSEASSPKWHSLFHVSAF